MSPEVKVAIVGAGPAGIAAAMQLKRSGIAPLLFECGRVGGLLHNANLVENYPGFPYGIGGAELAALFRKQLEHVGVEICCEEVLTLDHTGGDFIIETTGRMVTAGIVVLASGTKPQKFTGSEITEGATGKIFYDIDPLRERTGMMIAIVGAGDAAFDYALNLAQKNRAVIINRGSTSRALPLLQQRAQASPRIEERTETRIEKIEGTGEGLVLHLAAPGGKGSLSVDSLLVATGRGPRLDYLVSGLCSRVGRLQAEGALHLAGDVRQGEYRQATIAVGDGVRAAMQIFHGLRGNAR